MVTALFYLLAGLAIACAISCVYHKNPLYSAVSLIGVFLSLACIYLTLSAPFIAVTQILVYAGAIMVLVIFVIMLLNLDEDKPLNSLTYLYGVGGGLGLLLIAQAIFVFYAVNTAGQESVDSTAAGKTLSIGLAMYTQYLLPVEIVGILLLMAIVGAMIMSRRIREPNQRKAEKAVE
ncbi:MAG: NADH-quinone oxidoreductase subunit J [Acidobacteriota bacterium]|nr:NADH-quinone oxidoreductase subunit J [Acidobacteriota bacterium]MDH3530119.1 NADH-quinone oxidoreductase subunit J [Acidobacteriota bacterium]